MIKNPLIGMPKDLLIQYVQNPRPGVPQFMALDALKQQEEIQNSSNMPPQNTVAQDILHQATMPQLPQGMMAGQQMPPQMQQPMQAPQQQQQPMAQMAQQLPENQPGVSQLPSGMGQGFASGGIVAFSSGDLIDDEEDDDRELSSLFPSSGITLADIQALASRAGDKIQSGLSNVSKSYADIFSPKSAAPASDIPPAIASAAEKHNIPAEYLSRIAKIESNNDPSAANKLSSAKGLYGFTNGTWQAMGGKPGEQVDPNKSSDLAGLLSVKNAQGLKAHLGRNPTFGETYTAHHFGLSGAKNLMGMDPRTPMEKAVSPIVLKQNPNLKGKTVGQVLGSLSGKTGEGIVALAHGGSIPGFAGPAGSLVNDVPESRAGNTLLNDYMEENTDSLIAQRNIDEAKANYAKYLKSQEPFFAPSPVRGKSKSLLDMLPSQDEISKGINSILPANTSQRNVAARQSDALQNQMIAQDRQVQAREGAGILAGRTPAANKNPLGLTDGEAIVNEVDLPRSIANTPPVANTSANKTADAPRQVENPFAQAPSDMYEQMLAKSLKAQTEDLEKQKSMQLGLALLGASAEGLKSQSPYFTSGLGAALSGGVNTYGALKKQQADKEKDILGGQANLYKYSSSKENAIRNAAALERYREATLGNKPSSEDIAQTKFSAAVSRNPQILELNRMISEEQKNGMLTDDRYRQYQANIDLIMRALAKQYKISPDVSVQLPPVVDPIKPKSEPWWKFGLGSSTPAASAVSPERQAVKDKYNLN